ncbi:MAG: copper resistance protein NlpE N-terminal domain-containing protein [Dokdonella sp.]|nr:copper resistance protein NlpE N-terminal domain-containing protein [Dokdonella sp.]
MIRRIATPLALLLPLALALSACKPAAEPAPVAAPAEAPALPAESARIADTDATAVVHHDRPDPAGFDRKAFAGTFSGTVPCADCPGIETHLTINADGSFTLAETYQERDSGDSTSGTWTIDADGRRLLLDPDTKDAADRWFEIVSKDEVRMLDSEGEAIESPLNYSLRRG